MLKKLLLNIVNRRIIPINNLYKTVYRNETTSTIITSLNLEDPIKSNEIIDAEEVKRMKILTLEMDVLRQDGRKAPNPELLKPAQWDHILGLKSKSARYKFYTFLWKLEMKHENEDLKKIERRQLTLERKEQIREENRTNEHIIYGLSHTTFNLRVYDSTINHWHNNKLINAMMFGQKLVLDLSYDKHMTSREAINAAKQLMFVFAENRLHDNPFDLHFCNADRKSITMNYLQRHIPTMDEPWFPLNVHENSYLDLFPKERLVYLTPHCKTELTEFSHDDIYIIGAMVDTVNNEPLSLAKAKKLGLRMAKLPLDRYLQWGSGSGKSLTLNHVTNILLDQKDTGRWTESLKAVPRRKLAQVQEEAVRARFSNPDLDRYKFNLEAWAKPKK